MCTRKRALVVVTGLLFLFAAASAVLAADFHFTVTADPRSNHTGFNTTLGAINTFCGGPGAFHVSVGDIDPIPENRAVIDAKFGASAKWYPIIGNHEEGTGADMQWLRAEYDNANGSLVRAPLSDPSMTNADGPVGTQHVCYTWDYGNAHFIAMNQYWNGGPTEGTGTDISKDDTAASGDVVAALRTWLAADLAANTKPFVFVFGHEPAFPANRHVGDSLDQYPDNRDAFWQVLEDADVHAFFVGHTHYYSKHLGDKDGIGDVWQFDAGNAGNDPDPSDGMTFFDITVGSQSATIDVWRNKTGSWVLTESFVVVPEPATLGLLAVGGLLALLALGGLLALRRRRRRAA